MRKSILAVSAAALLLGAQTNYAQSRLSGLSFDVTEISWDEGGNMQLEYVGRATFGETQLTGACWDTGGMFQSSPTYYELSLGPTQSLVIAGRKGVEEYYSGGYPYVGTYLVGYEKSRLYVWLNGSVLQFVCVVKMRAAGGMWSDYFSVPLYYTETIYCYGIQAYD